MAVTQINEMYEQATLAMAAYAEGETRESPQSMGSQSMGSESLISEERAGKHYMWIKDSQKNIYDSLSRVKIVKIWLLW